MACSTFYGHFKPSKKGQNLMIFSLDVIRARKGDCLILHFGSKDDPHMVMIDGGPRSVYAPHLKPRLQQIRKARKLANNDSLPVDLLMVSHVDDDHIQGILDLTKELKTSKMNKQPLMVQVLRMWHNSFENIIGQTPKELTASFTSHFGAAAVSGDPPNDMFIEPDDKSLNDRDVLANLKVLASIQQGAQLRSDTDNLGFPLNPQTKGKLILADKKAKAIVIPPGLKFTVVGPMTAELKALHAKHQQWLKDLKAKGKTPEEALSAYVDKSVPNLSSIVVLAESKGKTVLLTGDARGDRVLEGLELVGLVKKGGKLKVDILKAPHHGSDNNVEQDFYDRIIAKHYVFSGNGEHGNPERESLEMLLEARGDDDYEVHLTYPLAEIDANRKKEWEKHHKSGPKWSPAKQSVAALLKKEPDFAKKFRFVEETKPHLINLLEKVNF
jgi:hypothetical protein